MKRKLIVYSIILYFALIIQSTLANYIKLFGVKPNLLLILIIAIAMIRGGSETSVFGFFVGLMQDILSGSILGPFALLGLLTGTLLGGFNKKFYKENIFMCITFTFLISLIYESLLFIPSMFTSGFVQYILILRDGIVREAIYNTVICIPVFLFVLKISHRFEIKEKEARKF